MHQKLSAKEFTLIRMATYASVSVASILILAKIFAWHLTGSVSLQATLVDSVLDGAASLINLFAVRHALRPADHEHRFGHGKIEALAAMGQSGFIAASACWLGYEAVDRFIHPEPITEVNIGISVMALAIFLTLGLVFFQRYVIKRTGSAAIEADSIHYKSDLYINVSVVVVLVTGKFQEIWFLDTLFGLLIALYILYTSSQIMRYAFDILIDREFPDSDRNQIIEIALKHTQVNGIHDLRTRSSGTQSFIQLHLEMDGALTLKEAHRIAIDVTKAIQTAFPRADIIIHQDPVDDSQSKESSSHAVIQ